MTDIEKAKMKTEIAQIRNEARDWHPNANAGIIVRLCNLLDKILDDDNA